MIVRLLLLISLMPTIRAWRPLSLGSCNLAGRVARAGTAKLVIFPGEDPLEFVRREARRKAAEHMAMEEAEGNPKSDTFKKMYADALEEIEVEEYKESLMNGSNQPPVVKRDEEAQRRRVAALDDPWQPAEEAPARTDQREQVLQEIETAGGVTADSPEQQEVFQSLPDGLQSALASGSIANVRLALSLMSVEEVQSCRRRCVDVGMWAEAAASK